MTGDVDKLERAVEREMEVLRGLATPVPRPACLERVKAAVIAEAGRVLRRQRLLGVLRVSIGAAAALVLALGWAVASRPMSEPAAADPERLLSEWAAAMDESSQRLTSLVEEDWARGDWNRDEENELDDLLRSLDQSFERFDAL